LKSPMSPFLNTQPSVGVECPREEERVNVLNSRHHDSISSSLDHTLSHRQTSAEREPVKNLKSRPLSRNDSAPISLDFISHTQRSPTKAAPSPATSVMYPTPYRSSHMASKKAGTYEESLSVAGKRKLGNHLPRIASGDGDESWVEEATSKNPEESQGRRHGKTRTLRNLDSNVGINKQRLATSGVLLGDGVAGLPGRIPLKAPVFSVGHGPINNDISFKPMSICVTSEKPNNG
jgi:Ras GTPase-activating-like protein IQGAP2/3